MIRQRRPRPMRFRCSIDVTGFASVLIALLTMFMAAEPYHHPPAMTLAKVHYSVPMPGANREDALLVAVQRDGKIFFGTERIGPEELPTLIKKELRQGAPREVYIKADARARYRGVAAVLDGVRASGVEKIGFLTYQRIPSGQ